MHACGQPNVSVFMVINRIRGCALVAALLMVPAQAQVAEPRGDPDKRIESLKKAADLDPTDGSAAFNYAFALRESDPAFSHELLEQMVQRFPASEFGAQALYRLADDAPTLAVRTKYLERCRDAFPPENLVWSRSAMVLLFEAYGASQPSQARDLAEEMVKHAGPTRDIDTWSKLWRYGQFLVGARSELNKHDARGPLSALRLLEDLLADQTIPPNVSKTPLYLVQAEAYEAAHRPQSAYETLLQALAAEPSEALRKALLQSCVKLGKTPAQVAADTRAK